MHISLTAYRILKTIPRRPLPPDPRTPDTAYGPVVLALAPKNTTRAA